MALLPLVEMGTAPPIIPGYEMLCANDSILFIVLAVNNVKIWILLKIQNLYSTFN